MTRTTCICRPWPAQIISIQRGDRRVVLNYSGECATYGCCEEVGRESCDRRGRDYGVFAVVFCWAGFVVLAGACRVTLSRVGQNRHDSRQQADWQNRQQTDKDRQTGRQASWRPSSFTPPSPPPNAPVLFYHSVKLRHLLAFILTTPHHKVPKV